jgi:hypothetical protein
MCGYRYEDVPVYPGIPLRSSHSRGLGREGVDVLAEELTLVTVGV